MPTPSIISLLIGIRPIGLIFLSVTRFRASSACTISRESNVLACQVGPPPVASRPPFALRRCQVVLRSIQTEPTHCLSSFHCLTLRLPAFFRITPYHALSLYSNTNTAASIDGATTTTGRYPKQRTPPLLGCLCLRGAFESSFETCCVFIFFTPPVSCTSFRRGHLRVPAESLV